MFLQTTFEKNGFEKKVVNLNKTKNENTNVEEDIRKKRKISFKVKNISPKKNYSTTLSSNKVKELTLKFNELIHEEEPQIKKIVKRVNSKIEKPKIRPKPKIELRKKPSIKRKSSFRIKIDQKIDQKTSEHRHSVRKTIEIFENKSKTDLINKQNQRTSKIDKKKTDLYETLKLTKTTSSQQILKMAAENKMAVLPNNSFLWRQKSRESLNLNIYSTIVYDDNIEKNKLYDDTGQKSDDTTDNHQISDDNLYDTVEPKPQDDDIKKYEQILQKTDDILSEYRSSLPESIIKSDDTLSTHSYETFEENIYENPEKNDNIYEVLSSDSPPHPKMGSLESPHPIVNMSHPESQPEMGVEFTETPENFKENIYSTISELTTSHPNLGDDNHQDDSPTYSPHPKMGVGLLNEAKTQSYESINNIVNSGVDAPKFGSNIGSNNGSNSGSNRDSIVSYDLQNSLYGKYSPTSLSSKSSHFDEWIDLSDPETENSGFIVIQNKQKLSKKSSGWSNKVREQWTKNNSTIVDDDALSDSYHYYESLNSDEFDSFDSDSDNDSKTHQNDSGVEMGMANLPDLPKMGVTNQYGLTKLAQRLRKNWSLTKNDITKSLSRMTKKSPHKTSSSTPMGRPRAVSSPMIQKVEPHPEMGREGRLEKAANSNSMTRKKNWLKFRRTQSMAESNPSENEGNALQVFNPNMSAKSTFYLTEDTIEDTENQKPQVPLRKKTQRPQIPPPPIPSKIRNTSWYLESGLFKNETNDNQKTSFWYTEIGLYENNSKNMTVDDEKNKKQMLQKPDLIPNSIFYTDSETNEDMTDAYYNTKNEKFSTLLKDEPLYQFYDAEITENSLNISSSESEYDGYETVGETLETPQKNSLRNILKTGRTLWSELPEVLIADVLPSMNQTQKKLQEAKFEILTSETSYLNSLNILTDHFIPKICKDNFLSPEDQKILFGNINSVKKISEKLLNELEKSWNDSIFLTDICDIIKKYSDNYFSCYVDYCANQGLSDTILRKCRVEATPKNGKSPQLTRFGQVIRDLETNTNCQGLSLHSFLMLPMQRVTRLPLLVDAVLRRLGPQDDEYISCQGALRSLQDLVAKCNEAARQTERLLELKRLKKQLEFPVGMSTVDLLEEGTKRFLVKSGDLIQLVPKGSEEGIKLTFGKRFHKISLTIFLFEDWIVIAKKKNEEYFNVLHHCPRSFLELSPPDGQQLTIDSSLLLFLTLLENQDGKEISFLFSCVSETERERWVEALCPTKIEDPNEVIYESWDCPQVQAIHHYEAQQPDELNLKRGDVVNVDRKMADQWFHGQKITDGQIGWFPGNFCVEVANPHLRARNLRQRYRLLALTDEFLNNSQHKT